MRPAITQEECDQFAATRDAADLAIGQFCEILDDLSDKYHDDSLGLLQGYLCVVRGILLDGRPEVLRFAAEVARQAARFAQDLPAPSADASN